MDKVDLGTTKYVVRARIEANGIVDKPDVVGAIFGQTEGLLGNELDLRELQKTGRIGRIDVLIESKVGKSKGTINIPSSMDKVETSIIASALETIDRVGPCEAIIKVDNIEDVRSSKRKKVLERAKEILTTMVEEITPDSIELTEEVKESIRVQEIRKYGPDQIPAGPNINDSDSIIVVEGRADVLNLLKYGVNNAIAVEGTSVPKTIADLSKEKTVIAFTDGDRGGELILRELLQVAEVDFVARAPNGKEVEELTKKEIFKALRNKIPAEQYRIGGRVPEEASRNRIPTEQPQGGPKGLSEFGREKTISEEDRRRGRGRGGMDRGPHARRERLPPRFPPREQPFAPAVERLPKVALPEPQASKYRELFRTLSGTLKAYLLDSNNEVIKEVAVRDLAMALMNSKEQVAAVIFDGVVTQRLVEIAGEKGITYLIGAKIGTISKKSDKLNFLTAVDLGIEG